MSEENIKMVAQLREAMGLPPLSYEELKAQQDEQERQRMIDDGKRLFSSLSGQELRRAYRTIQALSGTLEEGENDEQ